MKNKENILLFACLNDSFKEKLLKLSEQESMEVVQIDDKAIQDYVNAQGGVEINESERLTAFLKDERNRKMAYAHAKEIYRILTGTENIENAKDAVFTLKHLVQSTSLSWRKAEDMLNTLEAFGYVSKMTNRSDFRINFDSADIREHIKVQLSQSLQALNYDIERYKGIVSECSDVEDKEKEFDAIRQEIEKNIAL